jgi:hypothetical protein
VKRGLLHDPQVPEDCPLDVKILIADCTKLIATDRPDTKVHSHMQSDIIAGCHASCKVPAMVMHLADDVAPACNCSGCLTASRHRQLHMAHQRLLPRRRWELCRTSRLTATGKQPQIDSQCY